MTTDEIIESWLEEIGHEYKSVEGLELSEGRKYVANIRKLVETAITEHNWKLLKEIEGYKNPYPQDLFPHDNPEIMTITRGRFNDFIYGIAKNIKDDIIKIFTESAEE